jgi:hypothetical protein
MTKNETITKFVNGFDSKLAHLYERLAFLINAFKSAQEMGAAQEATEKELQ